MTCDSVRAKIDRGEPPPKDHLATCEACATYYDRSARLQRTLEKTELSARQLRAIEAAILPTARWQWRWQWTWAPVGALAAAAVLLVILRAPPEPEQFLARGSDDGSVKAVCVDPSGAVRAQLPS